MNATVTVPLNRIVLKLKKQQPNSVLPLVMVFFCFLQVFRVKLSTVFFETGEG